MSSTSGKSVIQLHNWLTEHAGLNSRHAAVDKHTQQQPAVGATLTSDSCFDSSSVDSNSIDDVIRLYKQTIKKLEQFIWQQQPSAENIRLYQHTFKNLEALYALKKQKSRYDFKIVIPVADRPQHLKQCLDSLLALCHHYQYGGQKNGRFSSLSVLIADDSSKTGNIRQHQDYCTQFSAAGLTTEYFGLQQQLDLVNSIKQKTGMRRILCDTNDIADAGDFAHKGASIMRNITYLKLHRELADSDTLIYFIDSDQEFCINIANSDERYYAINYFHYLNEIFHNQDISVLTGKVVGDPPVSPAVMAGNFQQDISNFIATMAKLEPARACQLHEHEAAHSDDAAYHDMAGLFGFCDQQQVFDYHCSLQGGHSNADCFADFAGKLEHFFYGGHPTRKTVFNYEQGFDNATPARTVYTGNYVIRPQALRYFIPFAALRLRMAGPVLGRILKHRLQHRFVSANLPMLHNRTVETTGQSEFRAGVKNTENNIDFGNEFIRQFYGDVMLFTMEKLAASGLIDSLADDSARRAKIEAVLHSTYRDIRQMYLTKHHEVLQLKKLITQQLDDSGSWWHHGAHAAPAITTALISFAEFLHNISRNFDDDARAYRQCMHAENAQPQLHKLLEAILLYPADLVSWNAVLQQQVTQPPPSA